MITSDSDTIHDSSLAKVDLMLQKFDIRLNINEEELQHLPVNTSYIALSKHLFGLIDHLMMLKVLLLRAKSARIITSEHNWLIEQVNEVFYELDMHRFGGIGNLYDELKNDTDIETFMHQNGALAIFPARRGNIFRTPEGRMLDKRWEPSVIKLIREMRIPVVPVRFNSKENLLSYIKYNRPEYKAAEIWGLLGGSEHVVNVRIGQPISVKEIDSIASNARLGRYLRARTNAIGSVLEVKQFYLPTFKIPEITEELAPPIDKAILEKEMEVLRKTGLLCAQNEFEVFIARAHQIPNVLLEIGRLREMTFREVEEGTNKARDIDEYDLYYNQLIIYDKDAQQIAGGYRIGKGDEIYKAYGIKGFYISSLFKIHKSFSNYLSQSAELGRSYIISDYQKKRLPLFLLWKGILDFLYQNPQFRYLIGPLSISKQYSQISRHLIIEFIKKHYYDHNLAKMIEPRKPYKVKLKDLDTDILIQNMEGEIARLDNFIEEIEPKHFRIPVLMKKYIKQNARIISFNVDPNFSDVLDGLMILDLREVPHQTIETLTK